MCLCKLRYSLSDILYRDVFMVYYCIFKEFFYSITSCPSEFSMDEPHIGDFVLKSLTTLSSSTFFLTGSIISSNLNVYITNLRSTFRYVCLKTQDVHLAQCCKLHTQSRFFINFVMKIIPTFSFLVVIRAKSCVECILSSLTCRKLRVLNK